MTEVNIALAPINNIESVWDKEARLRKIDQTVTVGPKIKHECLKLFVISGKMTCTKMLTLL